MPSLEPLSSRIIVRRLDADEKTPGGILLPDSAQKKPHKGTVIAVGPGKVVDGKIQLSPLKVKDVVLFSAYAGNEVTFDGEALLIMSEEDVLAKVVK